MERLDRTCQPRETPKEDQPAALIVDHLLIVDEGALKLHQPAQHGHIVRLALDHMSKEHVRAAGPEEIKGNLLDRKNDGAGRQVFLDDCAVLLELGLPKRPDRGRLNMDLDTVLLPQVPGSGRRHGHTTLPVAFILATNTNAAMHAILLDGLGWLHSIMRTAEARKARGHQGVRGCLAGIRAAKRPCQPF